MGKFVIKEAKTGIKFDLKAGNGEVIASSQVYKTLVTCKKGIASVQKNAPVAAVEDRQLKDLQKRRILSSRFTPTKPVNSDSDSKLQMARSSLPARATRP